MGLVNGIKAIGSNQLTGSTIIPVSGFSPLVSWDGLDFSTVVWVSVSPIWTSSGGRAGLSTAAGVVSGAGEGGGEA
jgi:hypothetical protein